MKTRRRKGKINKNAKENFSNLILAIILHLSILKLISNNLLSNNKIQIINSESKA